MAMIAALYIVGLASGTLVRRLVQTAPLWIAVVLGLRRSGLAKWVALPFFVFWLCIMTLIWLYLLGWAHIVNGHFSPAEIAMTLAIGIASLLGLVICIRLGSGASAFTAGGMLVLSAGLQLSAFAVSLLPAIARR